MAFCDNCGKEIQEGIGACPYCGAAIFRGEVKNSYEENEAVNKAMKRAIIGTVLCIPMYTIPIGLVFLIIAFTAAIKAEKMGARGKKLKIIKILSAVSVVYMLVVLIWVFIIR